MKIISLNILGGEIFEPLKKFLLEEAPYTDFFCFQEVYDSRTPHLLKDNGRGDIFDELSELLLDFTAHYEVAQENTFGYQGVSIGLAIFAKKAIVIESGGKVLITDEKLAGNDQGTQPPTYFQYARFTVGGDKYTIAHIHGLVFPGSKLDTPARLTQSLKINEFFAAEAGKKILCGDFNLMPDTRSVAMIEDSGLRNLIKEFHIHATRNELDFAKYPEKDRQYFADYMFVSKDVKVLNFEVPKVNVSDHLPLKLQFE